MYLPKIEIEQHFIRQHTLRNVKVRLALYTLENNCE